MGVLVWCGMGRERGTNCGSGVLGVLKQRAELGDALAKVEEQVVCPGEGALGGLAAVVLACVSVGVVGVEGSAQSQVPGRGRLRGRRPPGPYQRRQHPPDVLDEALHDGLLLLLDAHHDVQLVDDVFDLLEQLAFWVDIQQVILGRVVGRDVSLALVVTPREMCVDEELVERGGLLVGQIPDGSVEELNQIGLAAVRFGPVEEDSRGLVDNDEGQIVRRRDLALAHVLESCAQAFVDGRGIRPVPAPSAWEAADDGA